MAAWNGHMYAVETLVEGGAQLNAKDREGQTALHKAAAQGNQQIVVYLAKKGADLSICDNSRRSPVDLALAGGHEALKWPMLQSWIKDLELDDYKRPPLHQAVRYGTTAQVEQILDEGYDINETDFWDRTALLEAARCGLRSMTQLLLERGADITFEGPSYFSVPSRENAVSLAADSCYVNYYGDKGKQIKEEQRRENALAIIQTMLKKLIATYGHIDGLKKSLGSNENQNKIGLAALEIQDEAELLQLATKLVLQEAGYRDSKRPRGGGCRFE
jgi:ankyrin repeat protein